MQHFSNVRKHENSFTDEPELTKHTRGTMKHHVTNTISKIMKHQKLFHQAQLKIYRGLSKTTQVARAQRSNEYKEDKTKITNFVSKTCCCVN